MQVAISLCSVNQNDEVLATSFTLTSQGADQSIESQRAVYAYLHNHNTANATVGFTMSGGGHIRLEVAEESLTKEVEAGLYSLATAALQTLGAPIVEG